MTAIQTVLFDEQKARLTPLVFEIADLGGPFKVLEHDGLPDQSLVVVTFGQSGTTTRFMARESDALETEHEASVLLALMEDAALRGWNLTLKQTEKGGDDGPETITHVTLKRNAGGLDKRKSATASEGIISPPYLLAEQWLSAMRQHQGSPS